MNDYSGKNRQRPSKTSEDRYVERRERRKRQLVEHAIFPVTTDLIADRDHLYHCYRELAREGGRSPGVDGLQYPDLSPHEAGEILGDLAERVKNMCYRPQPSRCVTIPKPGTDKVRTLSIPVVMDRVLAKALNKYLSPYWEKLFLDDSWGFRPGRNVWGMLLQLEQTIKRTKRYILAVDDVRNAFDNCPIDAIRDVHQRLIAVLEEQADPVQGRQTVSRNNAKDKLLWLIETVLCGSRENPKRGIAQGNNYSPTAMNALFHFSLDEPLTNTMSLPFWFRYADNISYLAQDVTEGEKVLAVIRQRLHRLGMSLKGEDGVFDLRNDEEVQLLGFRLTVRKGKLIYGLSGKAYQHLQENLMRSYEADHPQQFARQSLYGWIQSYAPAFETGNADVNTILTHAADCGFRELGDSQEIHNQIRQARDHWIRFRHTNRVQ